MWKSYSRAGCLLALTLLFAPSVRAQVLYGSLIGTVTDPTDSSVPNASVTVISEETNATRSATADESGRYSLSNLLPGSYRLQVTATGFKGFESKGNRVQINSVTRVDIRLELGQTSESVTVAAEAATLQTDKTDVNATIVSKEVAELPLTNYRNYQSLMDLVPGATPTAEQNAIIDTPGRSLTTNVNGTVRNTNTTRIDGAASINIYLPHHTLYNPPVETIESVNVSTNTLDAEQGLAGGAAITVNTKSGTNDLHGAVFAYHSNSRLRARNFFFNGNNPKNIFNIPGFVVGGPIVKNKLFYFGGWEGTYQRNNVSNFYTVPTPEMRAGDFSGFSSIIYDPMTGDAAGRGRTPFMGNIVPLSRHSAIARRMQSMVPMPNEQRLNSNYFGSDSQSLDRNNYDLKVNWVRNPKHTLWGKYGAMKALVQCSFGLGEAGGSGLCNGGGSGKGDTLVQVATVGSTYIVSPTVLIDQTFGYSRLWQEVYAPDYGKNVGLDLGIPGTNGSDIRQSGIPTFSISGLSGWGNTDTWSPTFRYDDTFTNATNANWQKGAHDVRFGFDLIYLRLNHWQPQIGGGPRGAFTFAGAITALNGGAAPDQYNAYAAYLLGLPSQVSKTVQFYDPMTTREWQFGWYVRDRWQISRRLTLSLGVRLEYIPLMKRKDTGIERYDIETNRMLLGGIGGTPDNAGIDAKSTQLSPRVGLAWRLGDKTVLRTGYGLSYDPLPLSRPFRGTYPVMISTDYVAPNSFSWVSRIEEGIPAFTPPDTSSGAIPVPLTASTITPPSKLRRGYIQSWNLILERELPFALIGSVGYVATKTVRQFSDLNLNAAGPGEGNAGRPLARAFGRMVDTTLTDAFADGNYHSLQATLNRSFNNGLMIRGSYTFGRAINENDEPSRGGLMFNHPSVRHRNRALAGFDRTHNFHAGFLYELPFGKGKPFANASRFASLIAGGWQVNGIVGIYSGTPFSVTASAASLNAPGNTQTADQMKPVVETFGAVGPGQLWFDTTAFAPVTQVRFGSTGRNILRGPGVVRMDASLFRQFNLSERFNLQFRAEAFNVPNHPQFNNPGNAVNSANFGMITSARPVERQIRLGLRLGF
jgi:hypothetical protein